MNSMTTHSKPWSTTLLILATESILLERYQIVFGNIVGLVLSTYFPFITLIFSSLLPVPSTCTLFFALIMHLYYLLPLHHRLRSDCLIQSAPSYTNRVTTAHFLLPCSSTPLTAPLILNMSSNQRNGPQSATLSENPTSCSLFLDWSPLHPSRSPSCRGVYGPPRDPADEGPCLLHRRWWN